MRDLPRQLSVEQLAELFEGETPLVERLAGVEDPLGQGAEEILVALSHEEKVEALNAHPAIGAKRLSIRSAEEQGSDSDPALLSELAYLNRVYEEKFGFRFVVFVAGRPKREIVQVLGERIGRTVEEELDTGLEELVTIARDRWTRI
jgi:2-oxo-4-hydroxy-4-carboxy--5-ureidoimidazoline (OHCU) decarboxylase